MTTQDFKRAFAIADSDADLTGESIDHFDGYGLRGFSAIATIRQLARLIRWQAGFIFSQPGGSRFNMEAVGEMRKLLARTVTILD